MLVVLSCTLLATCNVAAVASAPTDAVVAARARAADVQAALDRWRDAEDLPSAHHPAEEVSNLITGPAVDLYGDADGDGSVQGAVELGLLPGQAGKGSLSLPLRGCAGPDLLGGSWDEPAARWLDLADKIAAWTPDNNPFPDLESHAQRTIGWAQLTLMSKRSRVCGGDLRPRPTTRGCDERCHRRLLLAFLHP